MAPAIKRVRLVKKHSFPKELYPSADNARYSQFWRE